MNDSEILLQAKIHYYCREKFYHAMQTAALEGLKRFSKDPVYRFYYGISLVLEGRVQEGIRELDSVQDNKDVMLGCILALIYAHRKCKVVDREAVTQLDGKLKDLRKQAGDKMLYYAGLFLFFTGKYDKAGEYIDRMLKVAPPTKEGLVLKGWNEVLSKRDRKVGTQYFESTGTSNPEALFGKAKCLEKLGEPNRAQEIVNQAVVLFPGYLPAFIEKMKIHFAMLDWDQMLDSCHRALSQNKNCLEAQRFLIIHLLCKEGNYKEAGSKLQELISAFDTSEPKNSVLYYETSQLFARLCGRQNKILQHTFVLVEKASALDPNNSDYVTELGYQCILQNKVREAMKYYRTAIKLDEASVSALIGVIWCQLLEGQLEVASQQLELLKEIHKTSGMTSELLFLCALLSHKQSNRADEVLGYLNECVDTHFQSLEGLPLGLQYLLLLNPDLVLQVVKLYLHYILDKPIGSGQALPPTLKKCISALQPVIRTCPGILECGYLMAKLKYLSNDLTTAQSMLEKCVQQDSSYTDAQLLLAQILLHQGNVQSANQTLEMALSYSFEVRDKPVFHLIKAQILKQQGELEESVKTLHIAMSLAGMKPSSASNKKEKHELGTNDKVSLYLELAETHRKLDQQHEAIKVMQDAVNEFQGTPEEVRVTIANADLALARGDIEQALSALRNITPDQAYFLQAREKMADIYLNYRKDRRLYASCYREVVEKYPTPQSYLMLGDAYMKIQEPERAIEAFEQALKKNPRDSMVARKIGQALVKTHHFEKAVTYYKAAIKTGGQSLLRYDLAELLSKMKRYREAEDIIHTALEVEKKGSDLSALQWESKFLLLLAQIYLRTEKDDQAVKTLQRAFETQSRVMLRVPLEQPDALSEQKQLSMNICKTLADQAEMKRDYASAVKYYKQTLNYEENNSETLLALAKLEMTANNLEVARQYCNTVLKQDKDNDTATLMMADLMFRKTDLESSLFHFQQLLERKPNYYPALARLIEAMRRLGKLDQVSPLLQKAEEHSSRSTMEAGYHYCRGLFEWYTGNTVGAMKSFNKARFDPDWGLIATYHMIEICINPDNETVGGETFESVDFNINDNEKLDYHEAAVRTAERLLNELRPKVGSDVDFHLMSNFVLLAKRTKGDAEIALNEFVQFTSDERHRDHVGAILGMATAYMILKQTPRARNQLKRVMKAVWNFGEAEYLEKCWLLLSDIYIQSGKYDMATDLLKRVLQYNKSCTKAYEYMGYIMEKEQSYKDAAQYYESAWKQGSQNNPSIGYKLAFNYMKAKRYVDAIDVCHVVLSKYPNYPKIRKDILEKSRANLRI